MGRTYNMYDPQELQDAFKSGMMDHCSGVVGRAAEKTAEMIEREQEEDA